jgi:hypothetical protein
MTPAPLVIGYSLPRRAVALAKDGWLLDNYMSGIFIGIFIRPRMADVNEVFVGLNQLTGTPLVDSFLDGTRSIQNMLTERNFPGIPTGLK